MHHTYSHTHTLTHVHQHVDLDTHTQRHTYASTHTHIDPHNKFMMSWRELKIMIFLLISSKNCAFCKRNEPGRFCLQNLHKNVLSKSLLSIPPEVHHQVDFKACQKMACRLQSQNRLHRKSTGKHLIHYGFLVRPLFIVCSLLWRSLTSSRAIPDLSHLFIISSIRSNCLVQLKSFREYSMCVYFPVMAIWKVAHICIRISMSVLFYCAWKSV